MGTARRGSTIIDRSCAPLKDSVVRVIAPVERGITAWLGGSILASLSTFQASTIKRSGDANGYKPVYEDIGPRIVSAFDFQDFQDWNTEFNSLKE